MTGPDILLLADAPLGGEGGRFASFADPYDALRQMQRRTWSAVVLTAPRRDFPGLCRAARRLQPASAVFGLCAPAAEPEVRPLVGGVLTDYFIAPPTRRDLAAILEKADAVRDGALAGAAGLSPHDLTVLLEATNSVAALEARLAEWLGRRIRAAVRWCGTGEIPAGAHPLLLSAGDAPRVLVAEASPDPLSIEAQSLLQTVEKCLPSLLAVAQRTEALHRLAITDPLTGAYNRRYFYHITDEILRRAAESKFRATLLLYDIDDFKHYNDTYGYATGDAILREMATLMKRTSRKQDIVARIGGDEFAMLFWDYDTPRQPGSQPPRDAFGLAERFLHAVHQHDFAVLGPEGRGVLGISGGLAAFPQDGQTCRDLLRSADRALKQAKRAGKNSIHLVDNHG